MIEHIMNIRRIVLPIIIILVSHQVVTPQSVVLNEIVSANINIIADEEGDNSDWIELFNSGAESVDITNWGLSDKKSNPLKWRFPDISIQPNEFLLIFASGKDKASNGYLHTNFKISSSGEMVMLSDSNGNIIDSIYVNEMPSNLSFGRIPDGGIDWKILNEPSPQSENINNIFTQMCEKPIISETGGFYTNSVTIEISNQSLGAKIYYSIDGSEPDSASLEYLEPLTFDKTTVLRARCFLAGYSPSEIETKTFLINESVTMPVVSLTTDPYNLWDNEYGIYIWGEDENGKRIRYPHANCFQDWERPVHAEHFDLDGTIGYDFDGAIRIHGGRTRGNAQKAVRIMAKNKYGTEQVNYQIFPDKNINVFKSFLLRNSGNDWGYSQFRDGMMQYLVKDKIDLEVSGFRPAIVFMNGEYWGLESYQERVDDDYLASNKNVDPNNIEMLEYFIDPNMQCVLGEVRGTKDNYEEILDYLETNDITLDENYKYIESQIDIENYINYTTSQIYFDNTDWPGNNIKFWRSTKPKSKWRWILFDTDFGFGLQQKLGTDPKSGAKNTLFLVTMEEGKYWFNPPKATFLLRTLLKNSNFKNRFVNTMCDYLNTIFEPETVKENINYWKSVFQPEIARHKAKWTASAKNWETDIDDMLNFADERGNTVRINLMQKFYLSRPTEISLDLNDGSMGGIKVNSVKINSFPWNGKYFPNVPITLTAIPKPGYKFVQWSDGDNARIKIINLSKSTDLVAEFAESVQVPESVIISEINYRSLENYDTEDWVELYNKSNSTIDLSNWVFSDTSGIDKFILPELTTIEPKSCLVLCRESSPFQIVNSEIKNIVGDFNFPVPAEGGILRLVDSENNLIDSVAYKNSTDWENDENKIGYTYQVIDLEADNNSPSNWKISDYPRGTPGHVNNTVTGIVNEVEVPNTFSLAQNYPNPFNPTTTITYSIAKKGRVNLTIYNLLGQKIKTLVESEMNPGHYKSNWNGKNESGKRVSSGIYIYTLKSNRIQQSRKLIMMK